MKAQVRFDLDHCLKRLAFESAKPDGKQRHVPTIAELAAASGVTRQHINNMRANRTRGANLDVVEKILVALRASGFEVSLTDVIREVQP